MQLIQASKADIGYVDKAGGATFAHRAARIEQQVTKSHTLT
jgi:hypothetical protein